MGKRILVIDDDQLVIRSLKRYLTTQNYDVSTAENAEMAVERAKSDVFDLIISDIRMPKVNGIETLRRIKSCYAEQNITRTIPAIVITGYSGDQVDVDHEAPQLGIVDFIYKPFQLDEFLKTVKKNLELAPVYKRAHPRITANLPVKLNIGNTLFGNTSDISSETVDLSEGGACLTSNMQLPARTSISVIMSPPDLSTPINTEARVAWSSFSPKDGKFRCGVEFLNMENGELTALKKILYEKDFLSQEFLDLTKEIKEYLESVKEKFDAFDRLNNDENNQVDFIEENKKDIFEKLDAYFDRAWAVVKNLDKDKHTIYQDHFGQKLGYLLLKSSEINKRVYQKPFGYAGDFLTINYLYDYYAPRQYLGTTSYQKLVNNYTCNIPISRSTCKRKDYIRGKISEAMQGKDSAKILSVACGSIRELVELLNERQVNKPLLFKCLDFEKRVLDHVDEEIKMVDPDKRRFLFIEYLQKDIITIIKDRKVRESLRGQDLIYAAGLFDYLSTKMAALLIRELHNLLNEKGSLIIINASSERCSHRAYYELLGRWNLIYRSKEEMLSWTEKLKGDAEINFVEPPDAESYLFLEIKKPQKDITDPTP